ILPLREALRDAPFFLEGSMPDRPLGLSGGPWTTETCLERLPIVEKCARPVARNVGLHHHRALGGHRDHFALNRPLASGRAERARGGTQHAVQKQPQAIDASDAQLCRRQPWAAVAL